MGLTPSLPADISLLWLGRWWGGWGDSGEDGFEIHDQVDHALHAPHQDGLHRLGEASFQQQATFAWCPHLQELVYSFGKRLLEGLFAFLHAELARLRPLCVIKIQSVHPFEETKATAFAQVTQGRILCCLAIQPEPSQQHTTRALIYFPQCQEQGWVLVNVVWVSLVAGFSLEVHYTLCPLCGGGCLAF